MKTNCFQKYFGGGADVSFLRHNDPSRPAAPRRRRIWRLRWVWRVWRFNANRGATTSGAQYNNNGSVGSATISVDPVTHNIIVIADKQTSEQIKMVLASLDAPEPQVLIKVAFVEVQDNNASAIGVQGNLHRHE